MNCAPCHLTKQLHADGMSVTVFSPHLNKADTTELASVFDYQGGTHITHETIQYLVERHEFEVHWLEVLGNSTIPCTMVWGQLDPVAVPDVEHFVWTNYLENRASAPTALVELAGASHYCQVDHPEAIAQAVLNHTEHLLL